MRDLIIKKGIWVILTLLGLGFAACEDNIHDFKKQTGSEASNSVYITDSIFTYSIFWSLDGEFTGPDTIYAKFPVHLAEPAKSEMRIVLDRDDDLRDIYNAVHNTSYYLIHGDSLNIKQQTLTIEEGQTVSKDSISIAFVKSMRSLTDLQGYIIPLKIRNYEGTDVKIDYPRRHCYMVINVVYENKVKTDGVIAVNTAHEDLNTFDFSIGSLYPIQGQNDAKVQLSVRNDLIAAFNTTMGSDFQPISDGLPSSYDVNMNRGKSEGVFNLNYTGNASALNDPRGYVVPLEVTSVTGENIQMPADDAKMLYAVIYSNAIGFVAKESDIAGTKVADRSKYNMVRFIYNNGTAPRPAVGNGNSLFSNAMLVLQPLQDALNMTIDLGEEVENITGFYISHMTGEGQNYNIKTMDVAYATGLMYENGASIGLRKNIDLLSVEPKLPKNCYIKFDKPITARYIFIDNVLNNGGAYLQLNGFGIYTQP